MDIYYTYMSIYHISYISIYIYRFKKTDNMKFFNKRRETMELSIYYQPRERSTKSGH